MSSKLIPIPSPAVVTNRLVKLFSGVGGNAVDALEAHRTDQPSVLDVLEQALSTAGGERQPFQEVLRDNSVELEWGT